MVKFTLFGQIGATHDGAKMDLPSGQPLTVLALLLLEPGEVVVIDRITEVLWENESAMPGNPLNVIQQNVAKLRRILCDLPGCQIAHKAGGYLITVCNEDIDWHHFQAMTMAARTTSDPQNAADLLSFARALRTGEPLTGADAPGIEPIRAMMNDAWLSATELQAELDIQLGRSTRMIGELTELATRNPLREPLQECLVRALYHAGRRADALSRLTLVRETYVDELGIEPGKWFDRAQEMVLKGASDFPAERVTLVPRQLPARMGKFTGRQDELNRMDAMLRSAEGRQAPLVCVLSGPGGVGKTWLAIEWANRNIGRFPDGQLYVDLHGFDPSESATPTEVVLGRLLASLGVQPAAMPDSPTEQEILYRELIATRRVLVVLDNARDTDQVATLLPSGATCTVILTSRNQLTSLITRHSAAPLGVEPLNEDGARELLRHTLAETRVQVDHDAMAQLARWCGGLPLALSILAARAAAHPTFPLAHWVSELESEFSRLDALDAGEIDANLRTVLSSSDRELTTEQSRAFRLLGATPRTEIDPRAAAAVLGQPARSTASLLRDLEQVSLLSQPTPGRYKMHDLVGLYASDLAKSTLRPSEVDSATRRFVTFYLLTAENGERALEPHRTFTTTVPGMDGCVPCQFGGRAEATAWFDAEYACVRAAQKIAIREVWDTEIIHFASSLETYQQRRGLRTDHLFTWRAALEAARRLGEPALESAALRRTAIALSRLGQHDEALEHIQAALGLAQKVDRMSQAHAHYTFAAITGVVHNEDTALYHTREALNLYKAEESHVLHAMALNALGWHLGQRGDLEQARASCETALQLLAAGDDPEGEAATLDSLGEIAHASGDDDAAAAYYERALALRKTLSNTYEEASTHDTLGIIHLALGHTEQARAAWLAALNLYIAQARLPEADDVRARLASLK